MDKVRVEYNKETGKLEVDLSELFSGMSDEESVEFVDKYALWYPVMDQLVYELKNGYASPNYNPAIYKLREAILGNKELFESMFSEQIIDMSEVIAQAKKEENRWNNAYWKLYHFLRDKRNRFGYDFEDGLEEDLREATKTEKFESISFGSDNRDIKEFINWLKSKV